MPRPRAIFLDALGTMLELEPPWERIDPALVAGLPEETVREAFEAEISYYRAHMREGVDAASLAALRERCAAVLSGRLGRPIGAEAMMAAIRFSPYSDAAPALTDLREAGLGLVCVSNWDCSLPDVLAETGLAAHLDGVVTSAVAGAAKPDPAIFGPALELAGCRPEEALHVGDSAEDLAAANAAGIAALRIDRRGSGRHSAEATITSLAEIRDHPALSPSR